LASKLLQYDGEKLHALDLKGQLRGLAWDSEDEFPIIVGNRGQILKVQGNTPVPIGCGTRRNLRAVSVNPKDGTALMVGNSGAALLLEGQRLTKISMPTLENLRAVAWNGDGSEALIAGNNGALFKFSNGQVATVEVGRANLRDISWRPKSTSALITSNCFAEEFVPSPNLFSYDAETNNVVPLNEGRMDFIGVDWKWSGEYALVVGYDVVWHTGFIGNLKETTLLPIPFENRQVYPVAVAWKPSSNTAAIVTATGQLGMAEGTVFLWDEKYLHSIINLREYFFSDVAWTRRGDRLAAIAATETRTFSA
jgi:hypothetical protein